MYIPGRSRTGWRPFKIEMSLAPYATRESFSERTQKACIFTPSGHAKVLVRGGVSGLLILPEMGALIGLSRLSDDHFQTRDRAPSEGRVEPLHEVLREVPNLGCPCRSIDLDNCLAVAYGSHV